MLCLGGFELYSRWVPLKTEKIAITFHRHLTLLAVTAGVSSFAITAKIFYKIHTLGTVLAWVG